VSVSVIYKVGGSQCLEKQPGLPHRTRPLINPDISAIPGLLLFMIYDFLFIILSGRDYAGKVLNRK